MSKKVKKIIYLDHASAAPIDLNVQKSMDSIRSFFANPSAIHTSGVKARELVENGRNQIARLINAHQDEIIFTGGGTESVALAILGTVRNYNHKKIPHVITTSIEHPAVIENCRMLEKNNQAEVTYIDPDGGGLINPKAIRDALKENTVLVSIAYANNEIGIVQPITEIAKTIRHFRKNNNSTFPVFHTDACQAMNYLETSNIEKLGVDLMSFNSSKIYGPKGIGALYKKRNVSLQPLYFGGGQEYGLRSGTESPSLITGFAKALEVTSKIKIKESKRLVTIRDYSIRKLLSLSDKIGEYKIILNGDQKNRLPNNINISISGISSELLVIELDAKGIEVSSKSACKSESPDESYVISKIREAQNLKSDSTEGSLRITLGRSTKKPDIDKLVTAISNILNKYTKWK